ncbi:GNAT family N-acetyltransferase [Devosia riboflavina]|uniref:GNAT family N-acetyltransferase n=1 Tax=Devosia riboflavina TaxID=46914 RepID=UPI00068A78F2|nr:GNAT family N-acetyltransferase [Devosia riboflavina]
MSISVRRAEPGDVPAMSRVLTASIIELCAADHGNDPAAVAAWTRNKTPEGVATMLANANLLMFVAEASDRVGAVGAVTRTGEIALNYVAPDMRFLGLSKALLARLESELQALGFKEGRLEATSTAQRFYESAGWRPDGPQASGRVVNGYPMKKALAG